MKELIYSGIFCLLITISTFAQEMQPKTLLVCGDSKVLLVDYERSLEERPKVIWSWNSQKAQDIPEEYRIQFRSMDDCKSVEKGSKVLVSSSSGAVAILSSKDRSVLFYASVPNAHSVELLPNNRLVAAASTNKEGNKIMLFDIAQPNKLLFEDSLYSAHGVIWHAERNSLFALGYDVLREYKMQSSNSLVLVKDWKIPGEGGHDLQLTPDGNDLLITEHTGCWKFNLTEERFNKIQDFPDAQNVKSLGQNSSGQFIYTVPDESWWTHHVSFFQPAFKLAFPDIKVYKARWFEY